MTGPVFAAVRAGLATAQTLDTARVAGAPVDLDELDALLSDAVEQIKDIRGLIAARPSRS